MVTERNRRRIGKRKNLMEENILNQRLTIRPGADWSGDKSADGNITGADESLWIKTEMRKIQAANTSGEVKFIVRTVVRGFGVHCRSIGWVCDREFERNGYECYVTLIKCCCNN